MNSLNAKRFAWIVLLSWFVLGSWTGLKNSVAQTPRDFPGFPSAADHEVWYGVIEQPVQHLRTVFYWDAKDSAGGTGKSISVDQRMVEIPVSRVELTSDSLTLELKSVDASFSGKLTDATHAEGAWKQRGVETPMRLEKISHLPEDKAQIVLFGTLNAIVRKMDFQFRIYDLAEVDGKKRAGKAYFDSLSEQLTSILCSYEESNNEIVIEAPALKIKYTGKRNDNGVIEGTFAQGVLPLPLTIEPISHPRWSVAPKRPQTPQGKSTYREIEFQAINAIDKNVKIAGTMTLPDAVGKQSYPSVVMVTGSGPQDRDETILDHKPFLVIADYLTRHGFAVLRFDDRGTSKSTGDFAKATSDDFATDVDAVIAFARKHEELDPKKIFVIGHSEGGLIAPLVAHWNSDLAGIVMLAGPGFPGDKILEQQSDRIAELQGATPGARRAMLAMREEIHAALQSPIEGLDHDAEVRAIIEKYWPKIQPAGEQGQEPGRAIEEMAKAFQLLSTPWFRRFMSYDPAPTISLVQCPILGLWGELDAQVLARINRDRIAESITRGGNPRATLLLIPGLNHLFQPAKTGSPEEYGSIETTIDPRVLNILVEWLTENAQMSTNQG